jgi:hypothetical protein
MDLEVISRGAVERRYDTPILLVHGMWQGAWAWDHGFMDRLAESGFDVHALSLRGHGESPRREELRWYSTADFVADVGAVVSSLPSTPLLVGHSMGGWVVQHYLVDHQAPGAVLLASVPVSGIVGLGGRVIRDKPARVLRTFMTLSAYPLVSTPALAKHFLHSHEVEDHHVERHHAKLQDESFRVTLDMFALRRPRPRAVTAPMLVLSGDRDRLFSVAEQQRTARAYGAPLEVFPGMAHNMMLDPGWEAVADRVAGWAAATVA